MRKITKRQKEVLEAILSFTEQRKYPPTVRELAQMIGLKSPSSVQSMFQKLKLHGLVTREPDSPRTIRVIGEKDEAV